MYKQNDPDRQIPYIGDREVIGYIEVGSGTTGIVVRTPVFKISRDAIPGLEWRNPPLRITQTAATSPHQEA